MRMADSILSAEKTEERERPGSPTRRRERVIRITLLSVLFLIPCFWQSRIQAGDLSSHVYNAWLASLISNGKVSGLWIAPRSNNVMFDLELEWLMQYLPPGAAQRIAVSGAVLVFAWGAMASIFAVGGRSWWFVTPCVAVLAYGLVYEVGFFNFYLSMGICMWYLALFWQGSWRLRLAITPLLALAWLAHPFPVVWAVGTAAYVAIAQDLRSRLRLLLLVFGLLALVATRYILTSRYPYRWSWNQAFLISGANQVLIFGGKYVCVFAGLLFVWMVMFRRLIKTSGWAETAVTIPFQLWLLNAAAVLLLPNAVDFPNYGLSFGYVADRLSLAAGIMSCAVVGAAPIKLHEKIALAALAVMFFAFLFVDTQELNRVEDGIDVAVGHLPAGQRVVGFFPALPSGLRPLQHAIDRACIGRCFSYANYEPSSRQFRVRAQSGNSIVLDNYADVEAVETGRYAVKPRDLPLYGVFQCGPALRDVCLRSLQVDEVIGNIGRN
jgi:hypothetical protein